MDIEGAVEAMIVEITVDIEVVVVMIDTEDHLHPIIDVMITDGVQDLDLTHHVSKTYLKLISTRFEI